MPNVTTISPNPIVDNAHRYTREQRQAGGPIFPNLANLGRSRVGRKLTRKALDAYYVALRRYEARPAMSGPPIPNSEKLLGRREYYTLEQCRRGGHRSGETRRRNAQKRWNDVASLTRRGFGVREISRIVGYSPGWVSKLVKRLVSRLTRVFPEHIHHQPQPQPIWATRGSRTLTLQVLYRRYALQALDALEVSQPAPEQTRRERQFTLAQRRIVGRRGRKPSAGYLGALGKGSGVALGMAFIACRELDGLPINEAVIKVNREFGVAR